MRSEYFIHGYGCRIALDFATLVAPFPAPRCHATSKRTGLRCGAPAEREKAVCRFHGARGGGPKGKANGAWRTGAHTNEMLEIRRAISVMTRQARELMNKVGGR